MKAWGRFWSSNTLVFERAHIPLRSMVRSSKALLMSIFHNYTNYLETQTEYRFCGQFVNKPKASSICARTSLPVARGFCQPVGVASAPSVTLDGDLLSHVIDWWVKQTDFEPIRNDYLDRMAARGITRTYAQTHMDEFNATAADLAPEMVAKFKINRQAKVSSFLFYVLMQVFPIRNVCLPFVGNRTCPLGRS